MIKNNHTKKEIDAEIQATLKRGQRENSKFITTNCKENQQQSPGIVL